MNYNDSKETDPKKINYFLEISKNENIPCGSSVQSFVKMRQSLTGSNFRLEELMKLYEKTPVSDYFSLSSHSDSDFGVVRHLKREKKTYKKS